MRVLITGGCGFLGSNLAADAMQRGDEVLLIDNLSRVGAQENLDWLKREGEVRFVKCDVSEWHAVKSVIAGFAPSAIYHLAGQVAMTTSIASPRMDFETNALGTLNVLEAVRQHCAKTVVIYASTNKVYGDLENIRYEETESRYVCPDYEGGFDESIPLDFRSPYGCSKGAADQYVLEYARTYDLNTVVFRHSSMYGGRQFATIDQGWIGWFCGRAIACKRDSGLEPFTISGNGKQVRDVLHVDDVKRLYAATVRQIGAVRGKAFNVGGGIRNSLSLLELFRLLEVALGIRMDYTALAPRQHDQKVFVAQCGAITDAIGWSPEIGIREGIESMLEWEMRGYDKG